MMTVPAFASSYQAETKANLAMETSPSTYLQGLPELISLLTTPRYGAKSLFRDFTATLGKMFPRCEVLVQCQTGSVFTDITRYTWDSEGQRVLEAPLPLQPQRTPPNQDWGCSSPGGGTLSDASVAKFPIQKHEKILGFFSVMTKNGQPPLSGTELEVLKSLEGYLSQAVGRRESQTLRTNTPPGWKEILENPGPSGQGPESFHTQDLITEWQGKFNRNQEVKALGEAFEQIMKKLKNLIPFTQWKMAVTSTTDEGVFTLEWGDFSRSMASNLQEHFPHLPYFLTVDEKKGTAEPVKSGAAVKKAVGALKEFLACTAAGTAAWCRIPLQEPHAAYWLLSGFKENSNPVFWRPQIEAASESLALALRNFYRFEDMASFAEYLMTEVYRRRGITQKLLDTFDITHNLAHAADLDHLVKNVLQAALNFAEVQWAGLFLPDEKKRFLILRGAQGATVHLTKEFDLKFPAGVEGNLLGATFQEGKPKTIGKDSPGSETYPLKQWFQAYPEQRIVLLPAKGTQGVVGLFALAFSGGDELSELPFLGIIANQAAAALENALLIRKITQAKNYWEATFDSLEEIIFLVGDGDQIERANQAAFQALQQAPEKMIRTSLWNIMVPDPLMAGSAGFKEAVNFHRNYSGECRFANPDGYFWVTVSPLRTGNRDAPGAVIVARNITERKRLERQALQSSKLAAIGELAAGVAHEINNSLGYVITNRNLLEEYLAAIRTAIGKISEFALAKPEFLSIWKNIEEEWDLHFILEDTEKILIENQAGLVRVENIVRGLRSFSRIQDHDWRLVDINRVVEETMMLANNQLRYKVEVLTDLRAESKIEGSAGQLGQVLLNVLLNALYAVKPGGHIHIRTWDQDAEVHLEIEDDGVGISEEHLPRIFDPFFTTKDQEKGTGLGLSISHNIINRHRGTILVRSTLGKGTIVSILLPKPVKKATEKGIE